MSMWLGGSLPTRARTRMSHRPCSFECGWGKSLVQKKLLYELIVRLTKYDVGTTYSQQLIRLLPLLLVYLHCNFHEGVL
jgi:hypothetical protein